MSYSRRNFLKTGALFGLAAAIVPTNALGQIKAVTSAPSIKMVKGDRLADLTKSDFSNQIGEVFQVISGRKSVQLQLIQADDFPIVGSARDYGKSGECFFLKFYGFSETPLGQQTHTFVNKQLGSFNLFIVPTPSETNLRYYEAVINRI